MRIKNIAASIGTALLLVSNCVPIISSAAPEQPSISSATTSDSSTTTATTTSVVTTKPSTDIDWEQLRDEYQEAIKNELEQQKKPEDFYKDPYYDTEGNATLIESKEYKVIYSSTELLFTAVTTKDGHVFYIIINYADTDGDNVYFLNKVDDFDLYSLINSDAANNNASSDGSNSNNKVDDYIAQQQATTVQSNDSQTSTTASAATSGNSSSKVKLILLVLLVVGIGALGWIIPKFMNRPKKNKIEFEDDELEEISEDEV